MPVVPNAAVLAARAYDQAGGGEDEHAGHAAARAKTVEQEAAYRRGIVHRLLGFLGFATLALGLLCGNYQKWLSRNKRVAKWHHPSTTNIRRNSKKMKIQQLKSEFVVAELSGH
jgi:hypothetical protein